MSRSNLLREKILFLREHDPENPEIKELEKSLRRSKQGKSSKNKGRNYEGKFVRLLEKKFPNLKFGRTPSSGGYRKDIDTNALRGDVVCLSDDYDFKLHMELKNHRNGWTTVQEWYKQAENDCLKDKIPTVIMHQPLVAGRFKAKDFIMLELEDFFSIVDFNKIVISKLKTC